VFAAPEPFLPRSLRRARKQGDRLLENAEPVPRPVGPGSFVDSVH
jgi:hypothetical protein